jgi:UDP-4-amino-4,6-dideoxy-N-acetyl-beta-L-altrosamine N-acetyltransferase
MSIPEACRLRPMAEDDLARVLPWRNHPDVRRYMLSSHEIGIDEHRRWFERASSDSQRQLLIAEESGQPFGFVQFSGAAPGGVAEWGFYVAPGSPKGAGTRLCRGALRVAFEELLVHKVCGQVLASNAASVRFHTALGFQQEGILREQHCADGQYHDLICFGLLRPEWLQSRVTEEQAP